MKKTVCWIATHVWFIVYEPTPDKLLQRGVRGSAHVARRKRRTNWAMDMMMWTVCDSFKHNVPVFDCSNGDITGEFKCYGNSPDIDYFCVVFFFIKNCVNSSAMN